MKRRLAGCAALVVGIGVWLSVAPIAAQDGLVFPALDSLPQKYARPVPSEAQPSSRRTQPAVVRQPSTGTIQPGRPFARQPRANREYPGRPLNVERPSPNRDGGARLRGAQPSPQSRRFLDGFRQTQPRSERGRSVVEQRRLPLPMAEQGRLAVEEHRPQMPAAPTARTVNPSNARRTWDHPAINPRAAQRSAASSREYSPGASPQHRAYAPPRDTYSSSRPTPTSRPQAQSRTPQRPIVSKPTARPRPVVVQSTPSGWGSGSPGRGARSSFGGSPYSRSMQGMPSSAGRLFGSGGVSRSSSGLGNFGGSGAGRSGRGRR